MRPLTTRWLLLGAATLSLSAFAQQVPQQISFSARISNQGTLLSGSHALGLALFDSATGGTTLWAENTSAVAQQGVLALVLGTQTPLTPSVLDGRGLFLEVTVDGTTLSPRLAVVSVPYAVRASVAGSAALLGTLAPGDVALANHVHPGVYLPLSSSLSCPGTQKVTGLTTAGAVVCADDQSALYTAGEGLLINSNQFSVAFPPSDAGLGVVPVAARADHLHAGAYVPLNAAARCPGTQKAIGLNPDGTPVCGADVDTTYTNGPGIVVTGSQISANFPGMIGWFGTANTVARSDHGHAFACPNGFLTHSFPSSTAPEGTRILCSKAVAQSNVKWWDAARACATTYSGSELCTYTQLTIARAASTATHTQQTLNANYWMADRTADNYALYVNNTTGDDFDGEAFTLAGGPSMSGFYCCTTGNFIR